MKKTILLLAVLAVLCTGAVAQLGTATPVKTGAAFPANAPYLWVFGLTTGTPGVYACGHSPTCTSSGQWVGPLGSGGGGGGSCTSCADQALDNLVSVAINAPLTPTLSADLIIGYQSGGTGSSNVRIFGSPAAGIGQPAAGVFLTGGNGVPNTTDGAPVTLTGGTGSGNGGEVDIDGGTGGSATGSGIGNGGDIKEIAGSTSSHGTGNGGSWHAQAGLPNVASGSTSESWNSCSVFITCTWSLSGGTESIKLSTNGFYWGWVSAGISQVTVAGCPSAMNGTFTVATVTTGGSGLGAFVTFTWSQAGSATCSGNGVSVSGSYTINSGTPGVTELAGGGALIGSGSAAGGVQLKSGTSGAPGEIDLDTFGAAGLIKILNGNLQIVGGCITELNGVTLKHCGVPSETAEFNNTGTAQTANISGTLIASAGGKYRIDASAVITVAAAGGSPSSTLPAISVSYTDADTGGTVTQQITQTSAANTVGTISSGSVFINPQTSTAVTYTTGSTYNSSGSTVMQYVPHVLAEAF